MRRIVLTGLCAALVALLLAELMRRDPGYILLAYQGYTVETSLWVELVLLCVLLALLLLSLGMARRLLAGPGALRRWTLHRRARNKTRRGLISYFRGDWEKARTLLLESAERAEFPWLNYLLAARASHRLGQSGQVEACLERARQAEPAAGRAIDSVSAEMASSPRAKGEIPDRGDQRSMPS